MASSSTPDTGIAGNAPLGGVNRFGNTPCLDHLLGPLVILSVIDDVDEVQLGGRVFFSPPLLRPHIQHPFSGPGRMAAHCFIFLLMHIHNGLARFLE